VYTTIDAEGGKVRSADGPCAKGKFTHLKHSGYYVYQLLYQSKTLHFAQTVSTLIAFALEEWRVSE
jgi:hypothetical protein